MDVLGCGIGNVPAEELPLAKIPLAKICELLMVGALEAGFEDFPSVVEDLKTQQRIELRYLLKNLGLASNIECPPNILSLTKLDHLVKWKLSSRKMKGSFNIYFPKAASTSQHNSQTPTPIQARRATTSTCTPKSSSKKRKYEVITKEFRIPAPCVLDMASGSPTSSARRLMSARKLIAMLKPGH